MYVKIKFVDDTEMKEWAEEHPRVKDGLLVIYKGRMTPALYINMLQVKLFHVEGER